VSSVLYGFGALLSSSPAPLELELELLELELELPELPASWNPLASAGCPFGAGVFEPEGAGALGCGVSTAPPGTSGVFSSPGNGNFCAVLAGAALL